MHNEVKLRDFENYYMQEVLDRAKKIQEGSQPVEKLDFFIKGLVDELKNRTSADLSYGFSKDSNIVEPEEINNKTSTITAYRIFADDKPLGEVGVRTVIFLSNSKLEELHGESPFVVTCDGIVYDGIVPGYTPEGEKTTLIANPFACSSNRFKTPLFRVAFMRTLFDKIEESEGDWSGLTFLNNNTKERPMKRHDFHPIKLASYESNSLERELYGI